MFMHKSKFLKGKKSHHIKFKKFIYYFNENIYMPFAEQYA